MPTKTNYKFPCPVCTRMLEVRLDKKGKPYVICDACGIQCLTSAEMGVS